MKRYGFWAAVIAAAYVLNRFWLAPATGSRLLAWHFADFLAGGLMLCVLGAALLAAKKPLPRFRTAVIYALGCGLFWELVTPLYLARSVGDPRDVAAVTLGGAVMWLLLRKHSGCFPKRWIT